MIHLDDFHWQLGSLRWSANFDIPSGQGVQIQGPSGIGKSTLSRVFLGLESGICGDSFWKMKRMQKWSPLQWPRGWVGQDFGLFTAVSVGEQLEVVHRLTKKKRTQCPNPKDLLFALECLELWKSFPSELSRGQSQRVALARALLMEPEVLVLDEAFSAQEDALMERIFAQLRSWILPEILIFWIAHRELEAQRYNEFFQKKSVLSLVQRDANFFEWILSN